jgi:hypothetical protein
MVVVDRTSFTANGIINAYKHEQHVDISNLYERSSICIADYEVSLNGMPKHVDHPSGRRWHRPWRLPIAQRSPMDVRAGARALLDRSPQGAWTDENVMAKVREMTLPQMQRDEPIKAWIIDDTAFPN